MLTNHRVIIVLGSLGKGGAELQSYILAKNLKKLGYEVEVYAFHDGSMHPDFLRYGIKVTILNLGWGGSNYSKFLAIYKFRRIIRKAQPNFLIPFTLVPNIFSAFSGVKCIWNQRDEGIENFSRIIEKLAVRRVSCWVANSEGGAAWIASILDFDAAINIIGNGIALAQSIKSRDSWKSELGIEEKCIVVTMVGNLSSHKDHGTLIQAWSLVQKSLKKGHAVLVLAGRYDDQTQNIINTISELGLEDSVILLGAVSDISGLLDASDIFVLSSPSEGLSNAVIEAAQKGLPILGSNISGIKACISEDGWELLSPPGDIVNLSSKLTHVINSRQLRSQIGIKNKEKAIAEFSIDKMVSSYHSLIQLNIRNRA